MFDVLLDPHAWVSLATLAILEIVLGVDNIIFLSIASNQLAPERRRAGRRIGLSLALVMRIAMLSGIAWIIGLHRPVIAIAGTGFSWRDIVFAAGGLFLLTKGSREIHAMVEGEEEAQRARGASFLGIIAQIAIFDLVFSIDSVITAVGMTEHFWIMVTAVVFAILVMLAASGPVSDFIHRNPTVKMLALSFLLLIGMALVADAMHFHIPRGYLYFAVAFSGLVEALNQFAARARARQKRAPKP